MKKTAAWFLTLVLLAALRAGAEFAVNLSKAFLVSDTGAVLTEATEYDRMVLLENSGFYAARRAEDGKTVLLDRNGQNLGFEECDSVREHAGVLIAERGGKYALFTRDLAPVTDFGFTHLVDTEKGFLAFRTGVWDDVKDVMYVLSTDGTFVPAEAVVEYAFISFSEGLAAAVSDENGRYGYVDENGSWAIEAVYSSAGDFCAGLSVVGTPQGTALIDTAGNILLENTEGGIDISPYYVLLSGREGITLYRRNGTELFEKRVFSGAHGALVGSCACVYGKSSSRLFDQNGRQRAAFRAGVLLYPDGDTLIASSDNGMFLYDLNTGMSSSYCYSIQRLKNGSLFRYSVLSEDNKLRFGFMNSYGKKLTEAVYGQVNTPAPGYAAAEADGEMILLRVRDDALEEILRIQTEQ